MRLIELNFNCPACRGALRPTHLQCGGCGLKLEGAFQQNEFASLDLEELHFLRIFVHCEGRIRDMESALGVSYPTIKSRLGQLKGHLAQAHADVTATNSTYTPVPPQSLDLESKQNSMTPPGAAATALPSSEVPKPLPSSADILGDLQNGKLNFNEAIEKLRQKKGQGEKP